MNPTPRALAFVARLRLILAIAGMAWLLGYSPSVGGRIAAAAVVVIVLALDAMAGAKSASPAPVRSTTGRTGVSL